MALVWLLGVSICKCIMGVSGSSDLKATARFLEIQELKYTTHIRVPLGPKPIRIVLLFYYYFYPLYL